MTIRPWLMAALGALLAAAPAASLAAQNRRDRSLDDNEYQSRLDTTVALSRDGTVDLSLVSGEIIVSSWDRPQVKIEATSERGILRFDASPSRVALSVRSDRGDMGDTRYRVTIPATARLLARSVSGDISARGAGSAEVNSVSGDIQLSDVTGRATVESVSGGVRAHGIGAGLRVSSVSGDLDVSGVTGDVDAHTVSGEIGLDQVKSSYVRTETVSGDTHFSGPLDPQGRYEFHSHSGDIQLGIPPVGATFDIETFSGDVRSDYQMTLQPGSRQGGRNMQFTINGGGARVSARTFSGDVTIGRGTSANRED